MLTVAVCENGLLVHKIPEDKGEKERGKEGKRE